MVKMTAEQRRAVFGLYLRSADGSPNVAKFFERVVAGYDCIMIPWCNMWVGIERDGYRHT